MPRYSEEQYKQAISHLHLKSGTYYSSAQNRVRFQCCFHSGDNTPSFFISYDKGIYHCFGCGKSGTIVQLIREKTGLSISSLLGLEPGDMKMFNALPALNSVKQKKDSETYLDIRGVIVPFNSSPLCMEYLNKRFITPLVATQMNMKYAEDVFINGTPFKKRLLIPVYKEDHILVNMEGRDVTFTNPLKCLYPAKAHKPIYEWYKLSKDKPLYVFEGLIKMAVARSDSFFTNSTATLGSRVSDYQLGQLKFFKNVIIVPDNDKAGDAMISFLKSKLPLLKVLRIRDKRIKDVDEIPDSTGMTVQQYREEGNGFIQDLCL